MSEVTDLIKKSLKKRKRGEKIFKFYSILGISSAILFLIIILSSVFLEGKKAFFNTHIRLNIYFDPSIITPNGNLDEIKDANFQTLINSSLKEYFPEIKKRKEIRELRKIVSNGEADALQEFVITQPTLIGKTSFVWIKAASTFDVIHKNPEMLKLPEEDRLMNNREIRIFERLKENDDLDFKFNLTFFTAADSTEPEQAGIFGSMLGSFFTMLVTLILSFPIAVAAGIFLEELAPKNKLTNFIEVNINNLAAVPSIIFGLLGLAIFLNFMHLPRSAPIVGGMVLALMTLPTIIIATRASLKAVPPSIREAATGLGATKLQTVTHHVLPLSLPGILTGTIIGMSQSLGESAPLLMIGMVAFIVDPPGNFTDAATVLPVQIYLWKSTAARGFIELTAAGVLVLLTFLVLMNSFAVYIRKKYEVKW
mgnify:FL=1